ncbi:aldehyde dehydrogenase family 2 member C4-like [Gossypium australe]|uniref:Aldehyde dehydrogenase family 2 member C4-like n=1 Tax=Gossypium australe TaxID=47621 RepID=A0A5B6WQG7_9ROSI|nr:aldehyde dehydrogenase family 2 member C4-like [Gossypium australe]
MINVEEDIIISVTSDAPYIGADGEAIECSFISLEFVNATFIIEGNKIPMPKISKITRISLVDASMMTNKQDRFGLGYKPDARQMMKELKKKQERRRTRLSREEI